MSTNPVLCFATLQVSLEDIERFNNIFFSGDLMEIVSPG